jgi:sugar-specific transcriptional regulator TrmB
MSLQRVLNTLKSFGLKRAEAQVYVFLAKKGPHTGKDLCNALNMTKPQLYKCLSNLENKGVVTATPERPAIFHAALFEKALDLLVKAKLEEAQHTQEDKDEALTDWESMMKEDSTE